jgi:hypothetical protein
MTCKYCKYSRWEVSDTAIANIGYCDWHKRYIIDDRNICRDYNDDTKTTKLIAMRTLETERKYCPDCRCYVQAEFVEGVEDADGNTYDEWNCLECGCCIEWYEV